MTNQTDKLLPCSLRETLEDWWEQVNSWNPPFESDLEWTKDQCRSAYEILSKTIYLVDEQDRHLNQQILEVLRPFAEHYRNMEKLGPEDRECLHSYGVAGGLVSKIYTSDLRKAAELYKKLGGDDDRS